MRERTMTLWIFALVVGLALSGCATTGGGGGGDVAAAPSKPDYTQEMGENGLPTPRALRARYVEAIGGEKALMAQTSRTVKGKMEITAMGMSGDLTIYGQAPDKGVMLIELGGMGTMNNGYNGEVGWSDNPMQGPTLLEGDMLEDAKLQSDFYADLHYDETYPTQETVEKTEYNGEPAYKVRLEDARGKETTQYYSEATSYLIGNISTQSSPMGEMEVTVKMGEYKEFGGVMFPTTQLMSQMGMEIKTTVEEVTFDEIDPGIFEPPDSIKALMK